jgi:hypothetical protein
MSKEARDLFKASLNAGYSPAQAKERVAKFMTTGEMPADPTEEVWSGLIRQESGGSQSAVSPKGAIGVAQVMPKTAPEAAALAGVDWDPVAYKNDPEYNALIGRAYLRKQYQDFGSDELALAAYNAGPGAVRKAGGDISKLPTETQNYVPAILGRPEPNMALEPELDSPEDIAAAREALATPRDKAKQAFMQALEGGASLDEAKQAARGVLAPPQQAQPAPQQLNNEGDPVGGDDPMRVKVQDPAARQEELMSGNMLDRFTGGLERSIGGLDRGARKLLGQLLGDEGMVQRSEQQEQGVRDVVDKYDPRGSGFSAADLGRLVGDAGAFAVPGGMAAKAAAPLGAILGPALAGAGTGAVQGALQPTTEEDSQGANAIIGGLLGGALGTAGGAISRVVGSPDPARKSAVEALRQSGVEVPEGFAYDSPLSNVLRRSGGQRGSSTALDDNLTKALAKRLGMPEGSPVTNETLEAQLRSTGKGIGDANSQFTAVPDQDFVVDISKASRQYRLAGPTAAGQSEKIKHLRNIAKSGRPIKGDEYQALRSGLTADSSTGGAAEKNLNKGLRDALDSMFERQNDIDGLPELRSQYRLGSILRKGAGVPTEGYTAKALRNRLENASGKGRVDKEIRRLVQSAADLNPGSAIGGEAVGGASSAEAALSRIGSNPTILGGLGSMLRGVAGPASKAYDSGTIQRAVNDKATRAILINLLRGSSIPLATDIYTPGED